MGQQKQANSHSIGRKNSKQMSEIAARHGWIGPSVYQGMYNAITRAVEPELFKCLGNYGIRFHGYNPLAGGAFSKSFGASDVIVAGSRFDISHVQGKLYRDHFWNDAYLDALTEIHRSCEDHGLDAISVALRWLIHHSELNAERNDGVIIGASSLEQLRHNLTAVTEAGGMVTFECVPNPTHRSDDGHWRALKPTGAEHDKYQFWRDGTSTFFPPGLIPATPRVRSFSEMLSDQ
jgi:hypothetical protein